MNPTLTKIIQDTIKAEADAVQHLISVVDDKLLAVVHRMNEVHGKIIFTGMGKSAIIAQKIVATLNSTGTQAVFLHAADAIHGDMGIVSPNDLVVFLSKSGETPELRYLLPLLQNIGVDIVSITSNTESFLAIKSNYHIYLPVDREADPNNLAPTTSTTVQLVMGDAIAVALLSLKGFTSEKFALLHPGGNLGKMLFTTVGDLCFKNQMPKVSTNSKIDHIIIEISNGRMGATAVLDANNQIAGIITDGDLRRMLLADSYQKELTGADIMTLNPKSIDYDALAVEALEKMRSLAITQLLVTREGEYAGIIHIHDLLKEGIQ